MRSADFMLGKREQGKFRPPCDVTATEDGFVIRVEIAAMQADDFKLSLMNRKLVISGRRVLPNIERYTLHHQVEIETGEFRLEHLLPKPVDDAQVTANYQNGILQIELPYRPRQSVQVVPANKTSKDEHR